MNDPHDRDEVLLAFAVEPTHDRDTVDRYLRTYPEFAREILSLSTELRLTRVTALSSPAEVIQDVGLEKAWQEFRSCVPKRQRSVEAINPFVDIKGQAFATLARTMNVPRSILVALRDRLVIGATIPERILSRLSEALTVPLGALREYLAGPPMIAAGANFKSDGKPEFQGQVSFQELIQNTEMTEEQRRSLLEG